MAKQKKTTKSASEDWVKPTSFRLEPDVLAELDEVAAYYSAQFKGTKVSRTQAVRIAIGNERERIKGEK